LEISKYRAKFTGLQVAEDSSEHFSAWHQFLLLCTLPCFAAIAGLIFSPESPRHLLEAGQDVEAMLAYQRIFKVSKTRGKKCNVLILFYYLIHSQTAKKAAAPKVPASTNYQSLNYRRKGSMASEALFRQPPLANLSWLT
jgi:Sugar (and other) transporter